MSDDLKRAQDNLLRKMAGDSPIHKQIILLKLTNLLENAPYFPEKRATPAPSLQRSWLSAVGALLKRLDPIRKGSSFNASMNMLGEHTVFAINSIKGQISDAIEESYSRPAQGFARNCVQPPRNSAP